MKFLLAEDDAVSRRILDVTLRRLGHEVIGVGNGREAWAAFQAGDIDVVISDWVMPEVDGPGLCRMIRAEPRPNYVYVIMLTVLSGKGRFRSAVDAGADDFMTKPVDTEELEARLVVAERILNLHTTAAPLEGALEQCAGCGRIHAPDDTWVTREQYLAARIDPASVHPRCPVCDETTRAESCGRPATQADPDGAGKFMAAVTPPVPSALALHRILAALGGHGAEVTAIAFSPTPGELASASMDHTVRLWR